jgi:DNA adenine methylase
MTVLQHHQEWRGNQVTYPGGKSGSGVFQAIINQLPPHRVYIEPFLGSGAIMRLKRPAIASIGIDSDADVINQTTAVFQGIPYARLIIGDGIKFLKEYHWQGDELVYCDPPYLLETRRSHRSIYRHEMFTIVEHRRLLSLLKTIPAAIAISGYKSELYIQELSTWRSISFQTTTRGGHLATEWLWMNYPASLQLHDYRYLGTNFRERERIKRKQKRWLSRLKSMPDLERYALLSVVLQLALP